MWHPCYQTKPAQTSTGIEAHFRNVAVPYHALPVSQEKICRIYFGPCALSMVIGLTSADLGPHGVEPVTFVWNAIASLARMQRLYPGGIGRSCGTACYAHLPAGAREAFRSHRNDRTIGKGARRSTANHSSPHQESYTPPVAMIESGGWLFDSHRYRNASKKSSANNRTPANVWMRGGALWFGWNFLRC